MRVDDELVNLAPGMAVTVEIKTGSRTVQSYLLSPLLRYKQESLRENADWISRFPRPSRCLSYREPDEEQALRVQWRPVKYPVRSKNFKLQKKAETCKLPGAARSEAKSGMSLG
jgi:hypothetical protein